MKRIICVLLFVIIGICLMAACDSNNVTEEMVTNNFSLSVTVNKTEVKVGDIIKVTAIFRNLSGRDISIELTDWQTVKNIEINDILQLTVHPESVLPIVSAVKVSERSRKIISKDAVFTQSIEYRIQESENVQIDTEICFYMGENYGEYVHVSCKPIMIEVRD